MPGDAGAPFKFVDRQWRWWTALFWLCLAAWMIWENWARIRGFGLGDTDDNMRMMQVRGLLEGQGWYDLQQHRLAGSNIHWSRLVDLPIAGLKLLFTPLFGGRTAETIAVTVAPLLPMLVAFWAVALTARRLISPYAYLVAIAFLACGGSVMGMWQPLRLDHHGWQLAFLAWTMAALTDPKPLRAGITLGAATSLSLIVGLEMLLYLALAGGIAVLIWVRDGEPRRLFAYGVTLAGGCAFGYLVFASEANRLPVCDALSPVWLSAMVAAGAVAALLARANPGSWRKRLAIAALGGVVIAVAFALVWPHCLGRLEQSSPELERLWLSKVREAMPIWRHGWSTAVITLTLPFAGLVGGLAMLHVTNREARQPAGFAPAVEQDRPLVQGDDPRAPFLRWLAITLLALLGTGLLAWQTRAGPAAQLLSAVGAGAFAWIIITWVMSFKRMIVRVAGVAVALVVVVGLAQGWVTKLGGPAEPVSNYRRDVNLANSRCPTLWAMGPIQAQPRGMVMTFVDLGPRLITVTHHDAITGPYHRNAQQIVDVMRAFRGTPNNARATAERYHADYLLICPMMSESTIYRAEAQGGFYDRLSRGLVPNWLTPVPLPANSPFRMWRIVRTAPAEPDIPLPAPFTGAPRR
ncbi:MAG TPA: AcrB/AcrD/AcrF family protein [Allosphingosinicella sp.]|nr:AcrB/AcrD/AcrF family protein [Allosphingosinicella sp.]